MWGTLIRQTLRYILKPSARGILYLNIIFVTMYVGPGESAKAEAIKNKMMRNLEMARERVDDLCKEV